MPKPLRAAAAGLVAMLVSTLVSNLLFFRLGAPVLFDADRQSDKLLAVFFEMPPEPLMFSNGPLYLAVAAGIGLLHGLVFWLVEPALGATRLRRGLGFAVVLWVLMALYFEFHAPLNRWRWSRWSWRSGPS